MYVILVYDIHTERVNSVRTFLKQFLNWVQNSVFEGELTDSEFMRVRAGLTERIDTSYDSVLIYRLSSNKYIDVVRIGLSKAEIETIL